MRTKTADFIDLLIWSLLGTVFFVSILMMGAEAEAQVPVGVLENSQISQQQAEELLNHLFTIHSNDPRTNAMALNQKLREMGLPLLDIESDDFSMNLTYLRGIAGSSVVGAEFSDGSIRVCLPCDTGWNSFEYGLVENAMNPIDLSGQYAGHLTCLSQIPKVDYHVSDRKQSPSRFVAIPGSAEGRDGFYAFTDGEAFFYDFDFSPLDQDRG
ncbi:MAG: hypothetical protein AAF202_05300, partial [Pseudomonadota bacterium]